MLPSLCHDWDLGTRQTKLWMQGDTGSQITHPLKQGKVRYSQGAQPGEQFWITQSKPPTWQLLSATCVCSSRCHQQGGTFYWITTSTKLVTLQMVQLWQLQQWELDFVFLLLCKPHPQSIHPSLPTKSSATVLPNLSTPYIHILADHGKDPSKTTTVPLQPKTG